VTESLVKPIVGVISDVQKIGHHYFHTAGDKYLKALAACADVMPIIIPALNSPQQLTHLLQNLQGVFLTGGYSMIDPIHYGETKTDKPFGYDERRDQLGFQLIKQAQQLNLPILGVCRGFQEINVAMGGSLHQNVHETTGFNDHREDQQVELSIQYGPAHDISIEADGQLAALLKTESIMVNSLHHQGINQLGKGLTAEAFSDDGLVEAFSIDNLSFGLAVQWHPEWEVEKSTENSVIFKAFGNACRMLKLNS
jgi:putative glutamine amidotransferase